jgi:hypothetical protein
VTPAWIELEGESVSPARIRCAVFEHQGVLGVEVEPDLFMAGQVHDPRAVTTAIVPSTAPAAAVPTCPPSDLARRATHRAGSVVSVTGRSNRRGGEDQEMLMTTTETIPGYTIERVLGLVEAASSWGFRPVRGRVAGKAAALGANAIVGVHYAGGRPSGFSGCVLYGTAVVVSPAPE